MAVTQVGWVAITEHGLTTSRYEMEWGAGICDTSGVGGVILHGLNEMGVSLFVGKFDSNFFSNFKEIVVIYRGFLFVI